MKNNRQKSRRDRVKGYVVGYDSLGGYLDWVVKVNDPTSPYNNVKFKVALFAPGVMIRRAGIDVIFSLNEEMEAVALSIGHFHDDVKKAQEAYFRLYRDRSGDQAQQEEIDAYHAWRRLCLDSIRAAKSMEEVQSYLNLIPVTYNRKLFYDEALEIAAGQLLRFLDEGREKKPKKTVRDFKRFLQEKVIMDRFVNKSEETREFWAKLNRIGSRNMESQPPEVVPDIDDTVVLSDEEWQDLYVELKSLID